MEYWLAVANLVGGFSSGIATLVAIVGVPWAILQLRHSERQRLLAVIEQSVFDHFARLETRVLDARDLNADNLAEYSAAAAEIRRLVTLVALLEHRNSLERIPNSGAIRHIQIQVAHMLGEWNGYIAGYLDGLLVEPDHEHEEHRAVVERLMELYEMASCRDVSAKFLGLHLQMRKEFEAPLTRAEALVAK